MAPSSRPTNISVIPPDSFQPETKKPHEGALNLADKSLTNQDPTQPGKW
jgi:hypothetical protein